MTLDPVDRAVVGEQLKRAPRAIREVAHRCPCGNPDVIELMRAVAKRVGVSAQSMLRWVRDHARAHCPKPEPARGGASRMGAMRCS